MISDVTHTPPHGGRPQGPKRGTYLTSPVRVKLSAVEMAMLRDIVENNETVGYENAAEFFRLMLYREHNRRHPKDQKQLSWQTANRRGRPVIPRSGADIARRLGLRWDGEQAWEGVGKIWAFTDSNPRSPSYGLTFYVEPNSPFQTVAARFEAKKQECEAAAA